MARFWVSYAIVDALQGGQIGTGGGDMVMDEPPRDGDAVLRLAGEITDARRGRGLLTRNQHVNVLAWSRMGD